MGNKAPQPVTMDQFKGAFVNLGNNIKDTATDLGYKIKDTSIDLGYKIKDTSTDAGYKIKDGFTNDTAMDVYKSTANSLSVVVSTLTGVPIDTGFNNSSVPNYSRIQANNVDNSSPPTNAPPPSGVAPPPPTQPVFLPDNQIFETSIYNPYNTTTVEDEKTTKKDIDPATLTYLAIPATALVLFALMRR